MVGLQNKFNYNRYPLMPSGLSDETNSGGKSTLNIVLWDVVCLVRIQAQNKSTISYTV